MSLVDHMLAGIPGTHHGIYLVDTSEMFISTCFAERIPKHIPEQIDDIIMQGILDLDVAHNIYGMSSKLFQRSEIPLRLNCAPTDSNATRTHVCNYIVTLQNE